MTTVFNKLPVEIWRLIYEFDGTFKEIYNKAINSHIMNRTQWSFWTRRFLHNSLPNYPYRCRIALALKYINRKPSTRFPTNVTFYCPSLNVIYKNGYYNRIWKSMMDPECTIAYQTIRNIWQWSPFYEHGTMEFSLEFDENKKEDYRLGVITLQQYEDLFQSRYGDGTYEIVYETSKYVVVQHVLDAQQYCISPNR